jgi:hypothetical protein
VEHRILDPQPPAFNNSFDRGQKESHLVASNEILEFQLLCLKLTFHVHAMKPYHAAIDYFIDLSRVYQVDPEPHQLV